MYGLPASLFTGRLSPQVSDCGLLSHTLALIIDPIFEDGVMDKSIFFIRDANTARRRAMHRFSYLEDNNHIRETIIDICLRNTRGEDD